MIKPLIKCFYFSAAMKADLLLAFSSILLFKYLSGAGVWREGRNSRSKTKFSVSRSRISKPEKESHCNGEISDRCNFTHH